MPELPRAGTGSAKRACLHGAAVRGGRQAACEPPVPPLPQTAQLLLFSSGEDGMGKGKGSVLLFALC